MDPAELEARIGGIAALDHDVTRAVYRLLVDRDDWTSRDAAADALGLARSVAAFHLDKLVDARLVETTFRRMTGRSGPGAGRPSKLYRRSETSIEVSLPERRYDLAGSLLAAAVERAAADGTPVDVALESTAREAGRAIGAPSGRAASRKKQRAAIAELLARHGYEPCGRGNDIVLRNCPFHALAEGHRSLVCGMNRDLLSGVVEGVGADAAFTATLEPEPGMCCVKVIAS